MNRELDLSSNYLNNFDEIVKLGNIKSLKSLFLMKNGIETIRLPYCDYDKKLNIFVSLELININDNPIRDEVSIFLFICLFLLNFEFKLDKVNEIFTFILGYDI